MSLILCKHLQLIIFKINIMSENLNSVQSRLLKRSTETENLFAKNEDKYTLLKPIVKQVNLLAANNKKINSYIPARSENGEAATTGKDNLKTVIANSVDNICSFAKVYALDIEDVSLFNKVNYTGSDVVHMRDPQVYGFATTLVGVITPLLSVPAFMEYPVSIDDVEELNTNATTFNENLGDAKVIDSNNSAASQAINLLLQQNAAIIRKLNGLMEYFKKSDPAFYKKYHDVAVLDYSGIHHSGIQGIIKDASGTPVYLAIITGEGKNKIAKSEKDGSYRLVKIRSGLRTFTITAPGYQSQTLTIHIIRGQVLDININLQAQIANMEATA